MVDFLAALVDRSFQRAPVLRRRQPSLFEPVAAGPLPARSTHTTLDPEAKEANTAPAAPAAPPPALLPADPRPDAVPRPAWRDAAPERAAGRKNDRPNQDEPVFRDWVADIVARQMEHAAHRRPADEGVLRAPQASPPIPRPEGPRDQAGTQVTADAPPAPPRPERPALDDDAPIRGRHRQPREAAHKPERPALAPLPRTTREAELATRTAAAALGGEQGLAREAAAVTRARAFTAPARRTRSVAAMPPIATAHEAPAPAPIQVTIGRVEIRATAAAGKTHRPPQANLPKLGLDEYLRTRGETSR